MSALRTVEEQLADVLAAVIPPASATVPILALQQQHPPRTSAEALTARIDIPLFDNSAMDGFAVRFADVEHATDASPVRLRVVADLPAGSALDPAIGSGDAVRIMTGSVVPTDADAIVPFEDTAGGLADSLGDILVVRPPVRIGAHIRRRAEDVRAGDEILAAGTALGPLQLSAAAAAGLSEIAVHPAPTVAIVSTGTELVDPGHRLGRGQIPESNSYLLAGLVLAAGGRLARVDSVADDGEGLRWLLDRVVGRDAPERVDAVVFSGGVSAGAYEVVKNELAGTMTFSRVAMQPGKPQGFGVSDGTLLFGLPGNPVSAAVSFEVFVRPALLALQGRTDLTRPMMRLPAASGWRTPPGRRQYLPAAIDRADPGRWTVRPATAGGSGSHLAGGLAQAEAYAVVPAEVEAVAAGDLVDVMLIT